jgi:alkylation response protein AidB-like acyl-CoA dehydrogenase
MESTEKINHKIKSVRKDIYLSEIEDLVKERYNSANFPNISFPIEDWRKLTEKGILLSMIPEKFGGRNSHDELCDILEGIARYNLPLGTYTTVITVLFIRNVTKYGTEKLKNEVLSTFSKEALIGGFALTEPTCGSNLSKMTTTFEKIEGNYHIKGGKHWQAFTLTANWWLIGAKNIANEKEFNYFIIKKEEGWEALEEYNALGLKAIDYGRSKIDAVIPEYRRLNITSEKLSGAAECLCASRLSMAALASGFMSRVYKEAMEQTEQRAIGGGKLSDLGYVKYKLKLISANKTIGKALFIHLKTKIDFKNNLLNNFFEAQATKVLSTDKMVESALNYQQLCGGEGYRYNSPTNNSAYALLDARVFTIFDGNNDLLCQQITEYCIQEAKQESIIDFLKTYDKTNQGLELLKIDLSILNNNRTQEEKVMNGQIISRIFGLNCLIETKQNIAGKRLESDHFNNAVLFLTADIKKTILEIEILQNSYS